MSHVAEVTEEYLIKSTTHAGDRSPNPIRSSLRYSSAIARGVRDIVEDLKMKLVVIWSQTGATAGSSPRADSPSPSSPSPAITARCEKWPSISASFPTKWPRRKTCSISSTTIDALVQERKFAALGDRIVIVAGAALGTPGTLNGVILHTDRRTMDRRTRKIPRPTAKPSASMKGIAPFNRLHFPNPAADRLCRGF